MSFLLQFMLVPDDDGGIPVFPDAVEILADLFRSEVTRVGGRIDTMRPPPRASDDDPSPIERAVFADADGALSATLAIVQAIQSPERRPRVPMLFRVGLDRDSLADDVVWHERFATCAALCSAGHPGQALTTEAFASSVSAAVVPAALRALEAARLDDLGPSRRLYQLQHPTLPDVFPPLRTLNTTPNNLPVHQTHFVGRMRERRTVQLLIALYRLVTIIGGGGIGKTRLALQVAASSAERFPDGVWLVELASARHATKVAIEIAAAIGLEDVDSDPLALVAARLAACRCLIILDNCEFDPQAAATVAESLIEACPELRILAASRRALECTAEHPFVLEPMTIAGPVIEGGRPLSDAAHLFIDRVVARSGRPPLDDGDGTLVERLCVLLDGNPLAIELAAARLGAWDLATLYDRIAKRFDALGENPSAQHPRQRSLWATIDWSYQLLSPAARHLFEACAVFQGGAEGDAVLRVATDATLPAGEVRRALGEITDVFLLERREVADEPRWEMLATIGAFAAERLDARHDAESVRARHAGWFAELAAASTELINGPDQANIVRRLALEHRNLRAALEWQEVQPSSEAGLRMSVALRRYWACAGHFGEGRHHIEVLLSHSAGVDERLNADALYSLATLSSRQSDYARARACLDEALIIAERQSDGHLIGKVRNAYGNLAMQTGDVSLARDHFAAALDRMQELEHEVGIIAALNNLAMAETTLGDLSAATEHFETCLNLAREIGYARGIADALNNLGMVLGMRSDYRRTRRALAECVSILQQIGERRRLALAMANLANAALRQGRADDARQLCFEALAIQLAVGDRGGTTHTRLVLGNSELFENQLDEATEHFEVALEMMRQLDERLPDEAEVVLGLGEIARRRGDLAEADRRFRHGLAIARANGDQRHRGLALLSLGRAAIDGDRHADARVAILGGLELLARLGNRRGMAEAVEVLAGIEPAATAARLLGMAEAERRALGAPSPAHEAAALGALRQRIEAAIGTPAFEAALHEGVTAGLDDAVATLLAATPALDRPLT